MAFTLSSEAIDNLSELLPRYTQYNINGRLRDRFQLVIATFNAAWTPK